MARPRRIWVVDDDPELRTMLAGYLTEQGYAVRALADGEQLRARLEGHLGGERPDLLVLDLMLPGSDGLSLLRRLRDDGDDLPVLLLSARADGVDRIIGLEQGADDYLAKPFLPRELTARIAAVRCSCPWRTWCATSPRRRASGRHCCRTATSSRSSTSSATGCITC
jgi:two-component system phosphate regulon response regulator OmpR